MFTIDKMSEIYLPRLPHALPRWLNLLARVIGHHGGHFEKDTWMRSTCPGCSQLLYESDKRWAESKANKRWAGSKANKRVNNFLLKSKENGWLRRKHLHCLFSLGVLLPAQ